MSLGVASIPKSGPEIKNRCRSGVATTVCRRNHSSLQRRRLESDAELVVATAAAGGTITPVCLRRHPSGDTGVARRVSAPQSSRRKTKDSWSFPPITFVSRPLTPPYVPFGIRRFLTLCAIERNSPLGKGSQHGEVYRSPQHGALCLPHWPNILCYCSHRFAPSMA